jgi:hypothetical protein
VNDLTHLFGIYGPIESARVLLEKECAFVNFLRLDDALAAKDDLVNKLNCRIAGHTVKVGFGKPEAIAQIGCNELGANSQGPTRALCKLKKKLKLERVFLLALTERIDD